MKIEKQKVIQIILETLNEFCQEYDIELSIIETENTRLFGSDGILDSIGLVSFIVAVEEAIEEKLNISIVLANEKAMSRRTSPFIKVSYLADYIFEMINETINDN